MSNSTSSNCWQFLLSNARSLFMCVEQEVNTFRTKLTATTGQRKSQLFQLHLHLNHLIQVHFLQLKQWQPPQNSNVLLHRVVLMPQTPQNNSLRTGVFPMDNTFRLTYCNSKNTRVMNLQQRQLRHIPLQRNF